MPLFSEPAMGWPGTNCGGLNPYISCTHLIIDPFTLDTSVIVTERSSSL